MDLTDRQIYLILNELLPSAKYYRWYNQLLNLVNSIENDIIPSKHKSKNSIINNTNDLNLVKAFVVTSVIKRLFQELNFGKRLDKVNLYTRIGGKGIFKTFTDDKFNEFKDGAISAYQKNDIFLYRWSDVELHYDEHQRLCYDEIPIQCQSCKFCKVDTQEYEKDYYLICDSHTITSICSNPRLCPFGLISISVDRTERVKRMMLTRLFDKVSKFVSALNDDDWSIILVNLYEINPQCRGYCSSGVSSKLKNAFETYIAAEYLKFDPAMATQISKYIEKYGTN